MNFLETVNWESTVHDYEFTRQAHRQIMDVVSNESFEDMSSEVAMPASWARHISFPVSVSGNISRFFQGLPETLSV